MIEILISEIEIVPIRPQQGLLGFTSFVLNNQFYIGNVAIYTCPSSSNGFRLVFPNKKLASGQIVNCFHPINKDAEKFVTKIIIDSYIQLMNHLQDVK